MVMLPLQNVKPCISDLMHHGSKQDHAFTYGSTMVAIGDSNKPTDHTSSKSAILVCTERYSWPDHTTSTLAHCAIQQWRRGREGAWRTTNSNLRTNRSARITTARIAL